MKVCFPLCSSVRRQRTLSVYWVRIQWPERDELVFLCRTDMDRLSNIINFVSSLGLESSYFENSIDIVLVGPTMRKAAVTLSCLPSSTCQVQIDRLSRSESPERTPWYPHPSSTPMSLMSFARSTRTHTQPMKGYLYLG